MTPPFGYAGFVIWEDAEGWRCKRLLTGEVFKLAVTSATDAMRAVDGLVTAWLKAPPETEEC